MGADQPTWDQPRAAASRRLAGPDRGRRWHKSASGGPLRVGGKDHTPIPRILGATSPRRPFWGPRGCFLLSKWAARGSERLSQTWRLDRARAQLHLGPVAYPIEAHARLCGGGPLKSARGGGKLETSRFSAPRPPGVNYCARCNRAGVRGQAMPQLLPPPSHVVRRPRFEPLGGRARPPGALV